MTVGRMINEIDGLTGMGREWVGLLFSWMNGNRCR